MRRFVIYVIAVFFMTGTAVANARSVVWQGSKTFTTWSDVLNIDGSKLNEAKADDVLQLCINAAEGAQLQLSWGNGWTCFEGVEHKSISGDYHLLLTAQDATRLRQGLHIKGVNYELTAVTLLSNDGDYSTMAQELFAGRTLVRKEIR